MLALLDSDPLRSLAGDEGFNALGQQRPRILEAPIRAGAREVEVLLVLQGLRGRLKARPVLLESKIS